MSIVISNLLYSEHRRNLEAVATLSSNLSWNHSDVASKEKKFTFHFFTLTLTNRTLLCLYRWCMLVTTILSPSSSMRLYNSRTSQQKHPCCQAKLVFVEGLSLLMCRHVMGQLYDFKPTILTPMVPMFMNYQLNMPICLIMSH